MRYLLIILSLFLLFSPLFGQSERPESIVIPVSSVGDVSNTRKLILQNTLEDELKTHFRLVPQQKYEEVQEKVFEELEYEECTEDQCIMMIQEMLQVENVFHLQVIGEGSDTQSSLGWRTLDEKNKEEDFCQGCGTFELRKMIGGLVEKLIGGKTVEPVIEVGKRQKEILFERSVIGNWGWCRYGVEEKDGKYVGEIVNGEQNGQGMFTLSGGSKYVG